MTSVAKDQDRAHLRRALALARNGEGRVSPNPPVGAVVVSGSEVLGEGWHAELGGVHGEVAALADCRARGNDPAGATLFVSLEPCAHHGRQPPCTEAILAAGIKRVVAGCDDPSTKAAGRGPGMLRDEGVEFTFADGAEAAASRLLVQPFRKHARTAKPLVILKSATSLDGYTATSAGDSKWISGPQSRALAHLWRAHCDAIAVGISTALADDPVLTARHVDEPGPRQPTRVVFDSRARLPLDSALLGTIEVAPVLVVITAAASPERADALRQAGVELIEVSSDREHAIGEALEELGRRDITSLLLEGGAELAGSFIDAAEVDELRRFIAPVLLGAGRPLAAGAGVERVGEAERALDLEAERCGDDLLVRARLREW